MKNRIVCILMTVFLFALFSAPALASDEYTARQVLTEINLARTEPLKFAGFLGELRSSFQMNSHQVPEVNDLMQTTAGAAAVDEAIRFLSGNKPLPPLSWSVELAAAAAELIEEQGRSGATGHGGVRSSGMQERIEHHGTWKGRIAENIAYGLDDPRRMVIQMIVDDGVPGRGHRKNLFNSAFDSAGVSCGPHPRFGSMCVIDFSGGFKK